MKRVHRLQMGAFSLILGCCSLWACQPMGLNQAQSPLSTFSPALQSIQNYLFQVQAGFQIAAVDADDAAVIEPVRQQFEADLKAGQLESYQQNKDFSIQLLAGSEGNYFSSPELVQAVNERVLATLVVMLPDQKTAIFKGEFEKQRFYFADPSQELALASASKAYLMTADANFAIQTYKGEILPENQTEFQSETQTEPTVSGQAGSVSEDLAGGGAAFTESQAEGWESGQHALYGDPFAGDYPQVQPAYPVAGFAYGGEFPVNEPRYLPNAGAWAGKVEKVDNKYANKYAYPAHENGYIKTRIGQAAVPVPPMPQPVPVTQVGPGPRLVRAYANPIGQPPLPPQPLMANAKPLPRAASAPSTPARQAQEATRGRPVYRVEVQFQEPGQSRPLPPPQP